MRISNLLISILLIFFAFLLTSCSHSTIIEDYWGEYKARMIYPLPSDNLTYEDDFMSIRFSILPYAVYYDIENKTSNNLYIDWYGKGKITYSSSTLNHSGSIMCIKSNTSISCIKSNNVFSKSNIPPLSKESAYMVSAKMLVFDKHNGNYYIDKSALINIPVGEKVQIELTFPTTITYKGTRDYIFKFIVERVK